MDGLHVTLASKYESALMFSTKMQTEMFRFGIGRASHLAMGSFCFY